MDVLVLIDKLDDLVHNAKAVPLTDQVRIDREEIYDILDQMRATIPEEIKQARWIVKERQEMLAEAKREVDRLLAEAREQAVREASQTEIVKIAERQAQDIVDEARREAREARLEMEDWADSMLASLEVNLDRFLTAVRRGRERLHERSQETVVGAGIGPRERRHGRRPQLLTSRVPWPPMRRTIVEWVLTLVVAGLFVSPSRSRSRSRSACRHRPWSRRCSARSPASGAPRRSTIASSSRRSCTGSAIRSATRSRSFMRRARSQAMHRRRDVLKRVIGLPGEQVSERNGVFYVDGKKLHEPYLSFYTRDSLTKTWRRLGPKEYFVMGDNRIGSCDSRTWGAVQRSAFIGPVVATYWPPTRWTIR